MASQFPKRVCGVGNSELLPSGLLLVGFCSTGWKMSPSPPKWNLKCSQMVTGTPGEYQEGLRVAGVRKGRRETPCEGVGIGRN